MEKRVEGRESRVESEEEDGSDCSMSFMATNRWSVFLNPEESEAASVFMALRIALIENYVDRSASVPAAILDVPASDDPDAGREIVSGVLALSETVQVVCISSDPAASGRFAAAAERGQVNLVDAIRLDSPFRKVSGEN